MSSVRLVSMQPMSVWPMSMQPVEVLFSVSRRCGGSSRVDGVGHGMG